MNTLTKEQTKQALKPLKSFGTVSMLHTTVDL